MGRSVQSLTRLLAALTVKEKTDEQTEQAQVRPLAEGGAVVQLTQVIDLNEKRVYSFIIVDSSYKHLYNIGR